ncbi:MAG TPA: DUF1028 domain-containing protein [Solirubrobacteraceae bacterium]|nr:DUF1028 domain-containing protein [Solirubrobacteraceae bacterium]
MTYSIVARDPDTGELGVAVQSHWFSVGSIVTWAHPGVGAVATQANAEAAYGPNALALLADGVPAPDALAQLVGADPGGPSRQVAVVDAEGRVGVHTGSKCIAYAGHITGLGVSCQANIMVSDRVWPAMLDAFEAGAGSSSLTTRLLDALDAAEREGGDIRGRQSAAILVVPGTGEPWRTQVSLRVEDHPEPLPELRRVVKLHEAYGLAGQGDELLNAGRHDEAARMYMQASDCAPDNHELLFWAGLGTVQAGDLDGGVAKVERAIALQPAWRDLLPRLPVELAPAAPAVLARLAAGS